MYCKHLTKVNCEIIVNRVHFTKIFAKGAVNDGVKSKHVIDITPTSSTENVVIKLKRQQLIAIINFFKCLFNPASMRLFRL